MSLTLSGLRQTFPDDALILLLGQDSANSLDHWHDWQSIPQLAHLAIMTRPGESPDYGPQLAGEIKRRTVQDTASLGNRPAGLVLPLQVPAVAVSSTHLRKTSDAWRKRVPEAVGDYIDQHGLYRD